MDLMVVLIEECLIVVEVLCNVVWEIRETGFGKQAIELKFYL